MYKSIYGYIWDIKVNVCLWIDYESGCDYSKRLDWYSLVSFLSVLDNNRRFYF